MTLIISLITPDKVVQASDRLLTSPDGRRHEDHHNKAVIVECKDALVSIAYTGAANVGVRRTDEWLLDIAAHIRFEERTLNALLRRISENAAQLLRRVRPELRRLTFAVAGIREAQYAPYRVPFAMAVSNTEENGRLLPLAKDAFLVSSDQEVSVPELRTLCLVHGQEDALEPVLQTHLGSLVRSDFYHKADVKTVTDALVDVIRRCSLTPVVGATIGRNCMTAAFRQPWQEVSTLYYPEGASSEVYAPHFVSRNSSYRNPVLRMETDSNGNLTATAGVWIRIDDSSFFQPDQQHDNDYGPTTGQP